MIPEFKLTKAITTQYTHTVWDVESGIAYDELAAKCQSINSENGTNDFFATKADIMAYILDNARLENNPDDIFADKLCAGGIMEGIWWRRHDAIAKNEMHDILSLCSGHIGDSAYEASTDFGHLAPDWKYVMNKGISGIISDLMECLDTSATNERRTFFTYSIKCWLAVRRFVLRLAEHKRSEGSVFCSDNLYAIADRPPKTMAQAMQLTLLIYNLETNLECAVVRSLGHIDSLYYPMYRNDIDSGRYSEAELRTLIRHFFIKLNAKHVTANVPIALCGKDPVTGKDRSNDLTKLLLEEYDALDIFDPKFHVFFHDDIRKDIYEYILDMIRRGHNGIVFINTPIVVKALEKIGITSEDARDCIVYGCYEAAAAGKEIPATCGGLINICKAVEYTLYERTEGYPDFESFLAELKRNIKTLLVECMDIITAWERYYNSINPAPMLSATFEKCRKTGIDIFCGGAKYNNTSIVAAATASLTDMALAVKHCVFDEKLISFSGLCEALKANWKGYGELHRYCCDKCPKYGCGNTEADEFTADMCAYIGSIVNRRPNGRGGVFRCGMFSIDWRFRFGKVIGATPDGRFAGEQLSKNFCSCMGKDVNGVTALINSASKIDCTDIPDGCVLDIVLHPSVSKGDEGLTAMKALINVYFQTGGFAIQINVLDAETLKKAQTEPEKYKNLQVRLCGWNVYFVNLSKAEQDEFIRQTEMH